MQVPYVQLVGQSLAPCFSGQREVGQTVLLEGSTHGLLVVSFGEYQVRRAFEWAWDINANREHDDDVLFLRCVGSSRWAKVAKWAELG
eukprot:1622459-Amphidinium_carterae.2